MPIDIPTHLNCPFCPAQAFPVNPSINPYALGATRYLVGYLCPANHRYYIDVSALTAHYAEHEDTTGVCC